MIKRLLLWLIRFYQKQISARTPPCCRFYPTCSAYAYQAIEKRGILIGCALAAWRLFRCNPLFPGGYDPVPEKKMKYRMRSDAAKQKSKHGNRP